MILIHYIQSIHSVNYGCTVVNYELSLGPHYTKSIHSVNYGWTMVNYVAGKQFNSADLPHFMKRWNSWNTLNRVAGPPPLNKLTKFMKYTKSVGSPWVCRYVWRQNFPSDDIHNLAPIFHSSFNPSHMARLSSHSVNLVRNWAKNDGDLVRDQRLLKKCNEYWGKLDIHPSIIKNMINSWL